MCVHLSTISTKCYEYSAKIGFYTNFFLKVHVFRFRKSVFVIQGTCVPNVGYSKKYGKKGNLNPETVRQKQVEFPPYPSEKISSNHHFYKCCNWLIVTSFISFLMWGTCSFAGINTQVPRIRNKVARGIKNITKIFKTDQMMKTLH